jgi:hypothetical protein
MEFESRQQEENNDTERQEYEELHQKIDEQLDEIKFRLCDEIEGDKIIAERNCIGFFSIRRPWNMQGWGNSVYKRQFPYIKEEEDGKN